MKTLATFPTKAARAQIFACIILLVAATNSTRAQESLHDSGSLQGLKSGPTFLLNIAGGDANIHGLTVGRGGGGHISNTTLGSNALSSNVITEFSSLGLGNTSIGINSLYANESGSYNTAIGHYSAHLLESGADNTSIGADAFPSFTLGNYNVGVGSFAFQGIEIGHGNTAVGMNAGGLFSPILLKSFSPLTNNTFIGRDSGPAFADLINSTGIGYEARTYSNNQVVIGNEDVSEIGGYTFWTNFSAPIILKSNLQENVAGLDFILRLRPVTYQHDADMMISKKTERASVGRDGQKTNNQITDREIELLRKNAAITQSGFLPEEVLEAARETGYDFNGISVSERETGRYGIRYGAFIMPIVKSIQELNEKIEEVLPENLEQLNLALASQQEEIEKLQARNAQLEQQVADIYDMLQQLSLDFPAQEYGNLLNGRQPVSQLPSDFSAPRLEQNAPNPFHEQSTIRYFLPDDAGEARITITDIQGNRVRSVVLQDRGHGEINISGGSLASGTYVYSLVINGRVIDSKRMVIL